jgi:hypothetical protein
VWCSKRNSGGSIQSCCRLSICRSTQSQAFSGQRTYRAVAFYARDAFLKTLHNSRLIFPWFARYWQRTASISVYQLKWRRHVAIAQTQFKIQPGSFEIMWFLTNFTNFLGFALFQIVRIKRDLFYNFYIALFQIRISQKRIKCDRTVLACLAVVSSAGVSPVKQSNWQRAYQTRESRPMLFRGRQRWELFRGIIKWRGYCCLSARWNVIASKLCSTSDWRLTPHPIFTTPTVSDCLFQEKASRSFITAAGAR